MGITDSGRAALRRAMNDRLDPDEVRTVCFDLEISYDNLSGDTKLARIISLLERIERTGRGADLVAWLRESRSDVPWPDSYAVADTGSTAEGLVPRQGNTEGPMRMQTTLQQSLNSGSLPNNDQATGSKEPHFVEYGIALDEIGNFVITEPPTDFFDYRLSHSFPGIEGLQWFLDPDEAIGRLEILLHRPVSFEEMSGHGVTWDPIWWFRGGRSLPISSFSRMSQTRCLLDHYELEIDKLAVYRSRSYYRSFVYIEVKSDPPVGVYELNAASIQAMVEEFGFAREEYGLYQGIPITRACFDDGAAVIDGMVVTTRGAELRVHYLSRYNLLLTSKFSPINQISFDHASKVILDDLLRDEDRLDELCSMIELLPRHRSDIED